MLSLFEFLLVACSAPALYFGSKIDDGIVSAVLLQTVLASVCCYVVTALTVPQIAGYLSKRGLKGKDMGRRGTPKENDEIPSALGIVSGVVFLAFLIVTQMWSVKDQLDQVSVDCTALVPVDFPLTYDTLQLANYSAALLSICFMVLLGFADDVLDLPWRYKLLLPTVAALPLVATYRGATTVLVPNALRQYVVLPGQKELGLLGTLFELTGLASVDRAAHGAIIDLGLWYLLYMLLLAVFATNAINIYAGINGLEAGQSVVIGLAVLTANLYELAAGAGAASPHLFSARIMMPFLAAAGGLMYHNTFPASVFVGDTFCYFAGMTLACSAILGHFSKTLLLFLIPQIFNFLYSCPQLFKLYECPRHRLPQYDAKSDVMRPSTFTVVHKPKSGAADKTEVKEQRVNFTLINLVLTVAGPMHERTLTNVLLLLQVVCCGVGLALRYAWGPGLATPHPLPSAV